LPRQADQETVDDAKVELDIERMLGCKNLESLRLSWELEECALIHVMALRVDSVKSLVSLRLQQAFDVRANELEVTLVPADWVRIAKSLPKLRALG
jgi:hypothetical protein